MNKSYHHSRRPIGVVIVVYGNSTSELKVLFDQLGKQKAGNDYVVVIDNHPLKKGFKYASTHSAVNRASHEENPGFGGSCNIGAALLPKNIESICFLNPDTKLEPGTLDALAKGPNQDSGAWMPLIKTIEDTVNSAGNSIHVSGLSWCDGLGERPECYTQEKEVVLFSGACFVIKRKLFESTRFFDEYFLYQEDTDIALRLKLLGESIVLMPEAKVVHDYVYEKGGYKYYFLERNRYYLILRTYPLPVLLVLSPLMVIFEVGLWLVSIKDRRFTQRVRAVKDVILRFGHIAKSRKQIMHTRKISSGQFFDLLSPTISNPLLGALNSKPINFPVVVYCWVARKLVSIFP